MHTKVMIKRNPISISGLQIYSPSNILNQSQVIVMFKSGAGVEVLESKHYMAARVYLPWEFIVSSVG